MRDNFPPLGLPLLQSQTNTIIDRRIRVRVRFVTMVSYCAQSTGQGNVCVCILFELCRGTSCSVAIRRVDW